MFEETYTDFMRLKHVNVERVWILLPSILWKESKMSKVGIEKVEAEKEEMLSENVEKKGDRERPSKIRELYGRIFGGSY